MGKKYSQLSLEAKKKAREEYAFGWLEAFNEKLNEDEAHEGCMDCDEDYLYDTDGNIIEEEG